MARVGPRIYNMFPTLVGPVPGWRAHARRAAAMGFEWIFLNPIHETGASGSLYAIKDVDRLTPRLFPHEPSAAWGTLAAFVTDARADGLGVMTDLVINHTAVDSDLTAIHPHWYRRDARGDLYRPRAVDPANTANVTIWHDLAELDYHDAAAAQEMIAYWNAYLARLIGIGVTGFRCDAAYKVPAQVWKDIIAPAKAKSATCIFAAESLGCTAEEVEALRGCGFDYLFDSSKWWDFRAPWLLEQHERFRGIAPFISFPESHDTERVFASVANPLRARRKAMLHYTFAAVYGSGLMMPVGFEYGFRRPLHVVETTPDCWEKTDTDLSDAIAAVNQLKTSLDVLSQNGPLQCVTAPGALPVVLLREGEQRDCAAALIVLNPDAENVHSLPMGQLITATAGRYGALTDVTPGLAPVSLAADAALTLDPYEVRIFRAALPAEHLPPGRAGGRKTASTPRPVARVAIENVAPAVDHGRFAVKRISGEVVEVWADIFCDGHDQLAAAVEVQGPDGASFTGRMRHVDNDRWTGRFPVSAMGPYIYRVAAWRDTFASWRADVGKKHAAGQSVTLELDEGVALVTEAAAKAGGDEARTLLLSVERLNGGDMATSLEILLGSALTPLMQKYGRREDLSLSEPIEVSVDRPQARFSAWYELFPRSAANRADVHGTFKDVVARLPYIHSLGFDVLYMPPIHPIGLTNRKGRNNSLKAAPHDPGSPYAIGSAEGGHTAVHAELGTLADFHALVKAARGYGIEIALDFAIQCSLDHPWIKEHPTWFDWREDGSIKYAENPPKRYEDIVNVRFYGDAFPDAWHALRDVVLYWAEQGVRIFRVDNPHTKPLPFWEWMIRIVRERYPDTLFLAEAFTRPKMMKRLAKLGFSQSYTYFTWRNTKQELTDYLVELTTPPTGDFYRPVFFVNTPDINPYFLQTSGRPGFLIRAALAALLSTAWGLYSGFELCEADPLPGREEYLDSEKYELKVRDWDKPGNIRAEIATLNRIRRENPALREFTNLRFLTAHHADVLFFEKATANRDNVVWSAVSLDPQNETRCALALPSVLNEGGDRRIVDLVSGHTEHWSGGEHYIHLGPDAPYRIWRVELAA